MSLPLPYFGADTAKNTPHTAKKGILSPDSQLMKIETKVSCPCHRNRTDTAAKAAALDRPATDKVQ